MASTYRHPVGKETLSGYMPVRARQKDFFGPDPGEEERILTVHFGEGEQVPVRYYRTAGRDGRLKLAYTGPQGEGFRSFLRRFFKTRRKRGPYGVMVWTRLGQGRYQVACESLQQARVEKLEPGGRRFFAGARPISILHPAMLDLTEVLSGVVVPREVRLSRLRGLIQRALEDAGWQPAAQPAAGLVLPGGMHRAGARLHRVLLASDLYPRLLSLAAAFESQACDLGVLLVADGTLARRIERTNRRAGPSASLDRAVRNLRTLAFAVRGPTCLLGLGVQTTIR